MAAGITVVMPPNVAVVIELSDEERAVGGVDATSDECAGARAAVADRVVGRGGSEEHRDRRAARDQPRDGRQVAVAVCRASAGWLDRRAAAGAARTISDQQVDAVITKTLETTPNDATHWSTRSMASEVGLTQTAVSRIWRAFGLQPHRQETLGCPRTRCSSRRSTTSSALSQPARARGRAVRRREVPDPGARPDRADPVDAPPKAGVSAKSFETLALTTLERGVRWPPSRSHLLGERFRPPSRAA